MKSCGLSKYNKTMLQTTCFHLILSFLKIKRSLELVSMCHFLHNFWRKIFPLLYSINWPNFIVWLPLVWEIWATCVLQLFVNQVVTSWILKLTLSFSSIIFPFFLHDQLPWQKLKYLENGKSIYHEIKNIFHHF